MPYVVVRKTEGGLEEVSRVFAKRSPAESRRHALALRHLDWSLEVRVTPSVSAKAGEDEPPRK